MPFTTIDILNDIRTAGGYAARIPLIDQENLANISHLIPNDMINDYMNTITNQVANTRIRSAWFDRSENPFSRFYKENMPAGLTMRELYVDYIEGYPIPDEGTERGEFGKVLPNISEAYYTINFNMQWKITRTLQRIREAFRSVSEIESLNNEIAASLAASSLYDNMLADCQVLGTMLYQGGLVYQEVAPLTDETSIQAFMNTFKNAKDYMNFWTRNYNALKFLMRTPKDRMVFITTPEVMNTITIDWLAGIFNVDRVEMDTRIILVPKEYGFGGTTDSSNIIGILADDRFLEIHNQFTVSSERYVDGPLYFNMFHSEQWAKTYGVFLNAVAFVSAQRTAEITSGAGVTLTGSPVEVTPGESNVPLTGTFPVGDPLYLEFPSEETGTFSSGSHAICSYIPIPAATEAESYTLPAAPWKSCNITNATTYARENQTDIRYKY